MKKICFLLFLFFNFTTYAQVYDYAEYYIDTDPGYENATAVPVSLADSLNILTDIPTGSLPDGVHLLVIRKRTDTGTWSALGQLFITADGEVFSTQSQVLPPGKITYAEYFIDQKPDAGLYGTGTPIPFEAADEIDLMVDIPTLGLSAGLHQLYVNVRDSAGRWGNSTRMFSIMEAVTTDTLILPPGKVSYAEYFIDQKPDAGTYGSGTSIPFVPANEINVITDVPTEGLAAGLHQLYVNVRDSAGRWGNSTRMFSIMEAETIDTLTLPPGKISYVEYFIDQKPDAGIYGTGTVIPFEPANEIDLMVDIPTLGLSAGLHQLYVNVRDSVGRWGNSTRMFSVQDELPGITRVRFLIDQHSDLTSAITIDFAAAQEIDSTFQVNVGPLSVGEHSIYAFAENTNGMLSQADSADFTVVDCSLPGDPFAPTGTVLISACETTSSYQVENISGATDYFWEFNYPAAGTISSTGNQAQINWNSSFYGQVQLTVRGSNSCGTGNYSNPLLISRIEAVPCAPTNFTATLISSTEIGLSWTDNSTDETGFVIERSSDNVSFSVITTTGPGQVSYTDVVPTTGITYYYRLHAKNANYSSATVTSQVESSSSGTYSLNYIKTYTPKEPYTETTGWSSLPVDIIQIQYQYFDGLGRPMQTVTVAGSPSRKDIVQPIVYDDYGRIAKEYLPYSIDQSESTSGGYRTNAIEEQLAFYQLLFDGDTVPYTTTDFDNSPLNRVAGKTGPGEAWHDHPSTIDYGTNTSDVINWEVDDSGILSQSTTPYGAGKLYKTTATDEDGHTSIEYKDKQGKVVLTVSGGNASTYYVYDDLDLLRYVIPPEASKIAGLAGHYTDNTNDNDIYKLCYYYEYDYRKRMILKKLPGADPIYMAYNKRDLLVATQDGEMRKAYKWLFTKYDAFNRPVITGIYQDDINTTISSIGTLADNATSLYETYSTTSHTYSNNAFPAGIAEDNLYSVTFYDDDDFVQSLILTDDSYDYVEAYDAVVSDKTKGQIMATKTWALWHDNLKTTDDKEWLYTINYYDKYGRVIQTIADNHKGGIDRVSNKYNFAGELLESKQEHSNSGITIDKFFTYDHMGRLQTENETINNTGGQIATNLTTNSYNDLGQLKANSIGNGLQTIDYDYNIRGWMTHINDPADLGSDLFAMQLKYNNGVDVGCFNGNIWQIDWKSTTFSDLNSYSFTYDNLNRLTGANYSGSQQRNFTTAYSYDLNGNINSLTRNGLSSGSYGLIDSLKYDYIGNQLKDVTDKSEIEDGFKDIVSANGIDYTYDRNGNLRSDNNKDIDNIYYNHLNLPNRIEIGTSENNTIDYVYDAAGIKLRKGVEGGVTTDYIGNFIYENDVLKYILTSNGRIVVDGSTYSTQYFIKDHLGNTRVTFDATGTVLQEDSYYPFGMVMNGLSYTDPGLVGNETKNKYLYNGKELQDDLGLDWYDYGARFYDAQIGRWTSVDPKLMNYYSWSPYHYTYNNPIKYIDPRGEDIWIHWQEERKDEKGHTITYKHGKNKGKPKMKDMSVQYKEGKLLNSNGKEYSGDNQFANDTKTALNYLVSNNAGVNSENGVDIIQELANNADVKVDIKESPHGEGSHYDPTTKILEFDPSVGTTVYETWSKVTNLGNRSAAVGLLHELGHKYREFAFGVTGFTILQYKEKLKEEQHVVDYYEIPGVKALQKAGYNETIRTSYYDNWIEYFTPVNVTSTIEKK